MLETSSEKAAEAVTPFASPLLASVERLVSRLASRIAGPQSQFSGRSLQFADRSMARQLANLGGGGAASEALPVEREIEPQKWLLPNSWVPSAAMLRGGSRSASAPAPVADAARPAAMTVTAGAAAKPGSVVPPSATAAPPSPTRSASRTRWCAARGPRPGSPRRCAARRRRCSQTPGAQAGAPHGTRSSSDPSGSS